MDVVRSGLRVKAEGSEEEDVGRVLEVVGKSFSPSGLCLYFSFRGVDLSIVRTLVLSLSLSCFLFTLRRCIKDDKR